MAAAGCTEKSVEGGATEEMLLGMPPQNEKQMRVWAVLEASSSIWHFGGLMARLMQVLAGLITTAALIQGQVVTTTSGQLLVALARLLHDALWQHAGANYDRSLSLTIPQSCLLCVCSTASASIGVDFALNLTMAAPCPPLWPLDCEICLSRFGVLTCRPRPFPSLAPSMIPGKSSNWILAPRNLMTPGTHVSVVNSYAATCSMGVCAFAVVCSGVSLCHP